MNQSLFKYQKFDTAKKTLQNKTIRFAAPTTFNDPYDAKPPYKFVNQNIDETKLKLLHTALKVFSKNSFILCLSLINNNLLMWGHYTDCHKGAVIEFNPQANFLKSHTKVNYQNKAVLLDDNYENVFKININPFAKALRKIFTTKNKCWEYEKEVRVVKDNSQEFIDWLGKNLNINFSDETIENFNPQEYSARPFKPEDIKTVYLGAKMEPKAQNEIIEIIKKDYSHIKTVYKARLSDTEYSINFDEISI